MINYVVFLTSLVCTQPTVINHTKSWTKTDSKALVEATGHCKLEFKNSPCLKLFEKTEEFMYRAICSQYEK